MGDDIHQDLIPGDGRQGRRNRRGLPQASIAVQTKEFTTGAHLHMLLQVVDSLCHNLRAPSMDDTGAPTRQHMEGEVKLALEGSIIKACYAIDSVIGESVRWSVEDSLDAEKKVRAVMQANVDFLQAQTKAAAHITRPCVRFQPRLVKLTDGTYACYLGDILTGNAIVGQGPHPEAALEAFDEQFAGKTSQQMR